MRPLLLLVLFYYVALPDPGHGQDQVGHHGDHTVSQTEKAFRKAKKGSALADDTEIMMPLPAIRDVHGVDGDVGNSNEDKEVLPWLTSFVERVKLDRRLPVMDYLRGSSNGISTQTVDSGMDMLTDRDPLTDTLSDDDAALESRPAMELEVMEDDEGNVIDVMTTTLNSTTIEGTTTLTTEEWSEEKELESVQEEDDDQGSEKEDGTTSQEFLKTLALKESEAALAEARVEEAEEILEDAIEELREEREDEILDETEEKILEKIEEAEAEAASGGGVLTEEMARMIEDEVVAEEERVEEDMHAYVETLFRGDDDEDGDDVVEGGESEAEAEGEQEYRKEDLLGQAGPAETLDDDE
ncbi:hypothetical protein BGX33_002666 [Mortierella sp. NVP41]|nr:hypothetical protein BGX33_002666 [Mortierella sp. NVP41]